MTPRWQLELYKKLFYSCLALVVVLTVLLIIQSKENIEIQNRFQNKLLTTDK